MIYLCCALCACASYIVYYFIIVDLIILLLFYFHLSFIKLLFDFCFSFNSFVRFDFHCSLFMRKIFNSDPGLYSRYFDPVPVVHEVFVKQHHLCKSN
jgi:hypothetical protein